jgi:hypothetical protein
LAAAMPDLPKVSVSYVRGIVIIVGDNFGSVRPVRHVMMAGTVPERVPWPDDRTRTTLLASLATPMHLGINYCTDA